jgi:hypothetical protein
VHHEQEIGLKLPDLGGQVGIVPICLRVVKLQIGCGMAQSIPKDITATKKFVVDEEYLLLRNFEARHYRKTCKLGRPNLRQSG